MTLRDFLERWGLTSLKIRLAFLEGEFKPSDPDRAAAWDLYVELLTRTATQPLPAEAGDERAALDSVHALFALTRTILKTHGPGSGEFAKLAIPVLNQVIRPFAGKWHRRVLEQAFDTAAQRAEFRRELAEIQAVLRSYTCALADMAGVEDLSSL